MEQQNSPRAGTIISRFLLSLLGLALSACSIDAKLEEIVPTSVAVPVSAPPPAAATSGRLLQSSIGSHFAVHEQGKSVTTGYNMHVVVSPKEAKEVSGGGYTIRFQ